MSDMTLLTAIAFPGRMSFAASHLTFRMTLAVQVKRTCLLIEHKKACNCELFFKFLFVRRLCH
jgi:hypothetical protein